MKASQNFAILSNLRHWPYLGLAKVQASSNNSKAMGLSVNMAESRSSPAMKRLQVASNESDHLKFTSHDSVLSVSWSRDY